MIAVLAAATLPLSGAAASAAAAPVKGPALTGNVLYKAGPLPSTKCAEKRVRPGDKKLARAYVDAVVACLDRTWGEHLRKAGLSFQKVRVKHVNRIPGKYCDLDPSKDPSQVLYCDSDRTMFVQLGKDWLEEPDDLWLFHITASVYGYHVQNLAGIAAGYADEPYRGKSELLEQGRRYNLQAGCLGGAFLKSVWPLKGRSSRDQRELVGFIQGDLRGQERWNGSTANVRAWFKQGFATGDAKSCNTWTAPPAKVA